TYISIFGAGQCGKSLKVSPIPQMVLSVLLPLRAISMALDLKACVNGYGVIPHAVGLLISPQKAISHPRKTLSSILKHQWASACLSETRKTTIRNQQRLNTLTCMERAKRNSVF